MEGLIVPGATVGRRRTEKVAEAAGWRTRIGLRGSDLKYVRWTLAIKADLEGEDSSLDGEEGRGRRR